VRGGCSSAVVLQSVAKIEKAEGGLAARASVGGDAAGCVLPRNAEMLDMGERAPRPRPDQSGFGCGAVVASFWLLKNESRPHKKIILKKSQPRCNPHLRPVSSINNTSACRQQYSSCVGHPSSAMAPCSLSLSQSLWYLLRL
jgi:hypothetical protein